MTAADWFTRADHLGPCAVCGRIVRAGEECSECLEEDGMAVHATCCVLTS